MNRFSLLRHPLSALVAIAVAGVPAAAPATAQVTTFRSGVDLVPLTVTVTDKRGQHVAGLTGRDFKVYEDGVEQPITFFATDDVPIDVSLVVDTSGSMIRDLPLVRSAAIGLVRKLRPRDRAAVVNVKQSADIPQSLTSDRVLVEGAIGSLSASGTTALYDGLYVVLRQFDRERRKTSQVRRQVLVVLSDGLDNRSRLAFEDVLDLARRVDVSIYVITLRSWDAQIPRGQQDGSTLQADYAMGTVARESGGRIFAPKSAYQLPAVYSTIAQELLSQYELGYVSARAAGGRDFRRVAVCVSPHTNALARTRSGYYVQRVTQTF